MNKVIIAVIRFYQRAISPRTGRHCRFMPSCSEYAVEAFLTHGFFKAFLLAAWRVLRCNPFGKVGYDPVPEKGEWKNPKRRLWRE